MKSYSHPNSSVQAPTFTADQDALYLHLTAGAALPTLSPHHHHIADDLRLVAERLDCDSAAAQLVAAGVHAAAGYWRDRRSERVHVVAVCVCIEIDGHASVVDAEAARRIAQRIASGLAPAVALERTLEQCERPTYTEAQIRDLERHADAIGRRLDHGVPVEEAWQQCQNMPGAKL